MSLHRFAPGFGSAVRIAYDDQIFSRQEYGGVSRYFFELASRLSMSPENQVTITAPIHVNAYLKDCPRSVNLVGTKIPRWRNTGRIIRALNSIRVPSLLKRLNPELVHETYYSPNRSGPSSALTVLTVFDMIHEKFPASASAFDPSARDKAAAVARADHIICISESTRQDLTEILNVAPRKISVVYLGAELPPMAQSTEPMPKQPYLLYVGQRQGHKNFAALLKAYGESPRLVREFSLVCFGGGEFTHSELRSADAMKIPRVRLIHRSGDDKKLAELYATATAFIYPSLYEGFGIPPLEAMSMGCPVVCSNTSSLPEVVGDAAETFDPQSVEQLRHGIERVVESPTFSEILIERGRERAKLFSWQNCADQTSAIYRQALSGAQ
jgi:glycosyltransferase involved in cell wall biosynthesis